MAELTAAEAARLRRIGEAVAGRILDAKEDQEDAVSRAFVRAVRYAEGLPLGSYWTIMVTQESLDILRALRRRRRLIANKPQGWRGGLWPPDRGHDDWATVDSRLEIERALHFRTDELAGLSMRQVSPAVGRSVTRFWCDVQRFRESGLVSR